jgi:hypothetical protein
MQLKSQVFKRTTQVSGPHGVNECRAADRSGLEHQRNIDKVREVRGEITSHKCRE